MRAMKRCFSVSRLLISSICLSSSLMVTPLLAGDHRVEHQIGGEGSHDGGQHRNAERHQERELALFALAFAPGK
jgi:hypothetical protein